MQWAGLPTEKIGMHSLRHGFLTAAKVAQHPSDNHSSITEESAMYAIWDEDSKTEFGYMTNDTRRLFPVTNFVGLTDTPVKRGEPSFVKPGETSVHISSVQFHRLPQEPPPVYYNPSHSYGLKQVRLLLKQLIYVPVSTERANQIFLQRQWTYLLQQAGTAAWEKAQSDEAEMLALKDRISRRGGLPPEELETPNLRKLGALLIDDEVWIADNDYSSIAQKLKNQLAAAGQLRESLHEPKATSESAAKADASQTIVRRDGRRVRIRRDWSLDEERVFIDALRNRLTATECAEKLMIRTTKHVQAHLSVLNRRRAKKGKQPLRFRCLRSGKNQEGDANHHSEIDLSSSELIDPQQQCSSASSDDGLSREAVEQRQSTNNTTSSTEGEPLQSPKPPEVIPPIPVFTTVRPYSFPQILASGLSLALDSHLLPSSPSSIPPDPCATPKHIPSLPTPPSTSVLPSENKDSTTALSALGEASYSIQQSHSLQTSPESSMMPSILTAPDIEGTSDDIIPSVQTPAPHAHTSLTVSPSAPPSNAPTTEGNVSLDEHKNLKQSPQTITRVFPSLHEDIESSDIDNHISVHAPRFQHYSSFSRYSSTSSSPRPSKRKRRRSPSRSISPQYNSKRSPRHCHSHSHHSHDSRSRSRSRERARSRLHDRYQPFRSGHRYRSPLSASSSSTSDCYSHGRHTRHHQPSRRH